MAATATERHDARAAGLSASEAERRLADVGANTIEEAKGPSPARRLIVFAQVGAVMAWRTNRESVRSIGLLTNRLIVAGIAVEIAMVALLAYTPGLDDIFHTSDVSGREWLFLLVWPPLVLGAEELRKAVVRRRTA